MSLLDKVVSAASGLFGLHGEAKDSLLAAILQLVNNPQTGGIQGLIQSFDKAGLGDIIQSWITQGKNLPISATQIESVFGHEPIRNFAGRLGITTDQASGQLAEYLPQVIDKLTPNGKLPEGGDLTAQGLEQLKNKLFG